MLHFAGWKKALVLGLCLLGLLFALPNVFFSMTDSASQARGQIAQLEENGDAVPDALRAQAAQWPSFLPGSPLNLGLDLRGGAHLLVEVETGAVETRHLVSLWPEARRALREQRDTVGPFRQVSGVTDALEIRLLEPSAERLAAAQEALRSITGASSGILGGASRNFAVSSVGDDRLRMEMTEAERAALMERTMAQSLEIVRRRIDEAGTREPSIQHQGENRILIQVPGIGSAEELLALLGQTAQLSFHVVLGETGNADAPVEPGAMVVKAAQGEGEYFILERAPKVSGEDLVDASTGFDQNGQPAVNFRFDATGARIFGDYTRQNVGKIFAIVLDDEVISAPRIISAITGGSGQITGNFDTESANRLSILLRAGALPAPLTVLEQRVVGPELGADSIRAGAIATLVAFVLVIGFMAVSYGLWGLFANVALVLNLAMLIGVLSALGATLTLPGIAGIVLTIGMAVDANVLIFERIREETRRGRGAARAIEAGYERAITSIMDANITTLIAAVILFVLGAGPVRGFAVTLAIGVVTSVFCAVFVTRLMMATWFARARPKTLTV